MTVGDPVILSVVVPGAVLEACMTPSRPYLTYLILAFEQKIITIEDVEYGFVECCEKIEAKEFSNSKELIFLMEVKQACFRFLKLYCMGER